MGREKLFATATTTQQSSDYESLITSSESLLREAQSILAETEHIGNRILLQMGQQRKQLETTSSHLDSVQAATR